VRLVISNLLENIKPLAFESRVLRRAFGLNVKKGK
jgi:hypothetical protein